MKLLENLSQKNAKNETFRKSFAKTQNETFRKPFAK
jgi:hypothetical protein